MSFKQKKKIEYRVSLGVKYFQRICELINSSRKLVLRFTEYIFDANKFRIFFTEYTIEAEQCLISSLEIINKHDITKHPLSSSMLKF